MSDAFAASRFPELVFGIAGPIGVDVDAIADSLVTALKAVTYQAHTIKLTTEMMGFPAAPKPPESKDHFSDVSFKIKYANALCSERLDAAAIARIGMDAIMRKRRELKGNHDVPIESTAYILRQLKRPDEVVLLRRVYGRQFILISAYGSAEQRKKLIETKLRRSLSTLASTVDISNKADVLIARDAIEEGEEYGQQLRETFPLADVFIDGISKPTMDSMLNRFIHALFGRTDIAPSKDEYGMYAAKSASLRSADLSRQIGAAIFTCDGELLTQGCNEVPKAFGGTYWDLEEPDFRDVRMGLDPNEVLKKEIVRDLIERLLQKHLLSERALSIGSPAEIVEVLTSKEPAHATRIEKGALADSLVMDLTEFGRVVHAEMSAICDAARLGRSLKGSILYSTAFPCHNCTKHILAAGITRVLYMEPYPKSRAKDLHENEIEIERASPTRVTFMPFLGISPYRYRDIFQKGRRKNTDGTARRWYHGGPQPLIESVSPSYIELELVAIAPLIGAIEPPRDDQESSGNDHVRSDDVHILQQDRSTPEIL
jgi:cytidine deaminase